MHSISLSNQEFRQFHDMIFVIAGISMSLANKQLVGGRLAKRLAHHGMASYGDYFSLLVSPAGCAELQVAVDLLTTNETTFFREPQHFALLRDQILPALKAQPMVRIWSGACTSGEEPYSLAMTLAESRGPEGWEIVASDICTKVLAKARAGHYPIARAADIPPACLNRYCLKGVDAQHGTFLVERALREKIDFRQINLNQALPALGAFDVIFLRNVMINFDMDTKRQVVQRLLPALKPGGYFLVSHSESLNGVTDALTMVCPSVYRKSQAQ